MYDSASSDIAIRKSYSTHLGSIVFFLGIFAGFWPSQIERSKFSKRWGTIGGDQNHTCYYIQIHFRCFRRITSWESSDGTDGLLCQRQRGQILSSAQGVAPLLFEERRISIFGLLSDSSDQHLNLSEKSIPAMYRVLILADRGIDFALSQANDSKLEWRTGLEGTIALHAAIFAAVSVWETEWNSIMDQVDEHLRFQLSQTMNTDEISKWMFDGNFERSRIYFTILQILRVFGECIRTVSEDLRTLDDLFYKPHKGFPQNFVDDELLVLRSNWESIIKHQKVVEERLFGRVLNKTEEVKSLRDGV